MPSGTKDLDVRILKELTSPSSFQWNFRESFSTIGKKLGADPETVRATLKRSSQFGLVEKWRLMINPELFGMKLAGVELEAIDEERKSSAVSQLKLVEGVSEIFDFHGKALRVIFYFEDEFTLVRKIELIKSICGFQGTPPSWVSNLPQSGIKLRGIDWRVIKAVLHDPRAKTMVIARGLGVSRRTVNRRLRRLSGAHVAYVIPVRNVKKSRGTFCSFIVFYRGSGLKATMEYLSSRNARIDFVYEAAKGTLILTLVTDNPADADELHRGIKGLEGVSEVRMGLMNDFIFVDDWIDRMVARKVAGSN
ncbi:MAG TPA: Lrp/AsnC family transcriptional regulator [Nitrososphaerales archaeon]|nr:Lrp/AsnC family transcriptional regulator [Nitrososphaerales archaeon]